MHRLALVIVNTIRGFLGPVLNFIIILFGIKFFGKQNWGTIINALLLIFLVVFIISWGNKEYLVRKYSAEPSKMYHVFFSNFFTRSLLLPIALVLLFFLPFKTANWCIVLVVLMHLYNTLESLIIYYQKFGQQLLAEILAFIIILGSIFFIKTFNLNLFLKVYCIAFLVKLISLVLSLKLWKLNISFNVSFKELKTSFWFFVLSLSGFLGSKIDLYVVNFTMSKTQVSEYQIAITAFLLMQSLSYLIILPFSKHIYRVSQNTLHKMKTILAVIAFPIVALCTFILWVILENIAELNLPIQLYVFGALSSVPIYFFIIDIMTYYRNKKESSILKINVIHILLNVILTFYLTQKLGITGAIISVFISQCSFLCFYKFKIIK